MPSAASIQVGKLFRELRHVRAVWIADRALGHDLAHILLDFVGPATSAKSRFVRDEGPQRPREPFQKGPRSGPEFRVANWRRRVAPSFAYKPAAIFDGGASIGTGVFKALIAK